MWSATEARRKLKRKRSAERAEGTEARWTTSSGNPTHRIVSPTEVTLLLWDTSGAVYMGARPRSCLQNIHTYVQREYVNFHESRVPDHFQITKVPVLIIQKIIWNLIIIFILGKFNFTFNHDILSYYFHIWEDSRERIHSSIDMTLHLIVCKKNSITREFRGKHETIFRFTCDQENMHDEARNRLPRGNVV